MKCNYCEIDYPEGIVNQAYMDRGYVPLCGICFEIIVGIELHGELACEARDLAIKYRSEHPELKPEVKRNHG